MRTSLISLIVATAACSAGDVDLEGRACGTGCLEGYVCHPERQECVCEITVGCDGGEELCPQATQVGDKCTCPGAFINCDPEVTQCEHGCRTCQGGSWGVCSEKEEPSTSAPELCDNRDNDGDELVDEGIYGCDCSAGDVSVEVCDHRDNDCNTGIDDGFDCRFDSTRACGDGGVEVCNSCEWSDTCVIPDGTPPGLVINFTATPGNAMVSLSWTYPDNDDLSLCVVRRRIVDAPNDHLAGDLVHVAIAPVPSAADRVIDDGLTNEVRYAYAAFCRDTAGQWNDRLDGLSNTGVAQPTVGPAENPTDFVATDDEHQQSTLRFTMPANAKECRVRRAPGAYPTGYNDGTAVEAFTTSGEQDFVDTNLTNGVTYHYAVFCSNGLEWQQDVTPGSNADTARPTDPVPPNVTNFVASDGEDSLSTVTFTMPDVDECRLVRDTNGFPEDQDDGTAVRTFTTPTPGSVRFVDVGLTNGELYHYAAFCRGGTTWNTERSAANSDTANPVDLAIALEGSVVDAGTEGSDLLQSGPVAVAANRLYLTVVVTRPAIVVETVSGLDLTWEHAISQCGAIDDAGDGTRVEIWQAFGSPSGSSNQVRVELEADAAGALVAVSRWVGVNPVAPLTANRAQTTSSGALDCSVGVTADRWWASLTPDSTESVVFGAVATLEAANHPTGSTVALSDHHFNTSGNAVGAALVQRPGTGSTTTLSGNLSVRVRWAAVAVELAP